MLKKSVLLLIAGFLVLTISGCKPKETVEYNGLVFELMQDDTYAVVGYVDESEEYYEVPSSINKIQVTVIGESAFSEHQNIINIDIPNTIVSIDSYAFSQCSSLLWVVIPENVISIGTGAFYDCSALTSVIILGEANIMHGAFSDCSSLSSVVIPKVTNIGWRAFYGTTSLRKISFPSAEEIGSEAFRFSGIEEVVIGSGVKVIRRQAFESCENLRTVEIEEGLETIEPLAFAFCKSIERIDLPDTLVTIGNGAFGETLITSITLGKSVAKTHAIAFKVESLVEIHVDELNPYFSSIDGVLFNKDQTTIIAYPIGRTEDIYELPEGVTKIGANAFSRSVLKTLIVPESIIDIEEFIINYSSIEHIYFRFEYNEEIVNNWNRYWKVNRGELEIIYNYSGDS